MLIFILPNCDHEGMVYIVYFSTKENFAEGFYCEFVRFEIAYF